VGSYSMPPPGEETHARRQITVIVLLLFGMVALYQFEQFALSDRGSGVRPLARESADRPPPSSAF